MVDEWISITDAAARLVKAGDPVDRSTLSRYLKKHSDALPLRSSGRSSLVNYTALLQHRNENIRLVSRPDVDEAPAMMPRMSAIKDNSTKTGAARKTLADAELRELDLAERRKELTPVMEVDAAARDALVLMKSSFERAVETEAAVLSIKYGWDERQARLALKDFVRSGVDVFHREMLKSLDKLKNETPDQEDPEMTSASDR